MSKDSVDLDNEAYIGADPIYRNHADVSQEPFDPEVKGIKGEDREETAELKEEAKAEVDMVERVKENESRTVGAGRYEGTFKDYVKKESASQGRKRAADKIREESGVNVTVQAPAAPSSGGSGSSSGSGSAGSASGSGAGGSRGASGF